jgi:hypothetical protein
LDSAAPPTRTGAPTAPYVYAATDERPRGDVEAELCAKASQRDWLYIGGLVLLDVGSILLDANAIQLSAQTGVRLVGPGLVGLSWGATVGGGYLALPKCSPGFVGSAPPEGDVRQSWPLAISLALLAGATAPVLVGLETGTGPVTLPWSVTERSARLFVAGGAGFVGALVPYLLPPKTWRAAKELERIRAGADATGAYLTYTVRF